DLFMPDRAIEHLETALKLAREIGSAWWTGMCIVNLSEAHLVKGDNQGAAAALAAGDPPDSSNQLANLTDRRFAWVRGELALRNGDAATALRVAVELLDSVPGIPLQQPIPVLLRLRGEALAALGRLE